MGSNRWPVDVCRTVSGHIDRFYAAAATVATETDGAVIASIDGVLQERMVRLKDLSHKTLAERLGSSPLYADWMGSRHMSALDTSVRGDVVATLTLSEESGRVTVFVDRGYETDEQREIGGRWRARP